MEWEKLYNELRTQNWVILMILGSASFFLMSPVFTLGILTGGLVIIGNFNLLQHNICRAFSPEGVMTGKKGPTIAKSFLRLAIVGMFIYILITKGWVHPIGLCIGLSIIVISIFNLGIRIAWNWKRLGGEAI